MFWFHFYLHLSFSFFPFFSFISQTLSIIIIIIIIIFLWTMCYRIFMSSSIHSNSNWSISDQIATPIHWPSHYLFSLENESNTNVQHTVGPQCAFNYHHFRFWICIGYISKASIRTVSILDSDRNLYKVSFLRLAYEEWRII